MAERRIGIRDLKSKLSECVRYVKGGHTMVVTEHGRPVARMIPDSSSLQERLDVLVRTGGVIWTGRRLRSARPVARIAGRRTVADLLIQDRE